MVCSDGMPGAVGEIIRVFRYLRPGSLIPAVSQNMEWAYFLYFNVSGSGFYLAMRNEKFNDPTCARAVKEELLGRLDEVLAGDTNAPVVRYIVANAMFPSG